MRNENSQNEKKRLSDMETSELYAIAESGRHTTEVIEAQLLLAERLKPEHPDRSEFYLMLFFQNYNRAIAGSILPGSFLDTYVDPLSETGRSKLDELMKRAKELIPAECSPVPDGGQFQNPTNGTIRPQDDWGSGEYGAPRDGGNRRHAGVDYLGDAGASVYAGIGGTLEVLEDGVRITGRTGGMLYTVRQLHINPLTNLPNRISVSQQIATVKDLTEQYPGIKNHCHIEIYQQPGDNRCDPTPFF
ncbi:MAG: M23 family metallopeptidase [Planctomycetaceae bacterium]|nr:M23 family metallopeptidase [Planctomycetaceae bacterium]